MQRRQKRNGHAVPRVPHFAEDELHDREDVDDLTDEEEDDAFHSDDDVHQEIGLVIGDLLARFYEDEDKPQWTCLVIDRTGRLIAG